MSPEFQILLLSSAGIAVLHTISGPDHYLPFIVLSKSGKWNITKTISWTLVCGLGHIGSSVLLAFGGVFVGWNIHKVAWLENIRGGIAGWAFLIFGLIYMLWATINLWRKKTHKHFETDIDGSMFVFEHNHYSPNQPVQKFKITPWVIFIIFILGPCEPLIPLLFAPAVQHSTYDLVILIFTYSFFTLISMLIMVITGHFGFAFSNTQKLEKYSHMIAGVTLLICGIGMLFLNW